MKIKMKFFLMQSLFLLLFSTMVISCGTDNQQNNQDGSAMTEMDGADHMDGTDQMPDAMKPSDQQNTQMQKDNINQDVYYYPETYSYTYWDAERLEPLKVKATSNTAKAAKSDKVYTDMSKLDHPPLFSMECQGEENPEKCSNIAIQDYIRENADYPNRALRRNEEGLEYVTFIIKKDGKVAEEIQIESKGTTCADCAVEAKRLVAEMPAWSPAMKDGKAVNVKVVLPVRFDYKMK